MSRARELSRLGNANIISADSSLNVGFGTTSSIQYKLDVVGDANFTGVVTATSFGGDGSALTGVAAGLGTPLGASGAGAQLYYTNKILAVDTNLTTDVPSSSNIAYTQYQDLVVGDGIELTVADGDEIITDILGISSNLAEAASEIVGIDTTGTSSFTNVNATGVVTATSFKGDGSALTGVGNTGYIDTASLTVSGIATFNGVGNFDAEVTAAGGVDITGGLKVGAASTLQVVTATTGTFSGAVNIDDTTASTSTSTGALIVDGGVGIAGSMFVGENVSIGGTLTYEDVTNIDSVGIVTAQTGVRVTAGGLVVTAGVSTFSGNVNVGTALTVYTTGVVTCTELTVAGHGAAGGSGVLNLHRNDATLEGGEIKWHRASDNAVQFVNDIYGGGSTAYLRWHHDGSVKVSLTTAGIITCTSVTETSDIALKTNIEPLTNVLDKINQLTGYKYDFTASDESSMGVIAQDVEKVFPELVRGEEGSKVLQYSGLIGALIESVKELSAKVDALESGS